MANVQPGGASPPRRHRVTEQDRQHIAARRSILDALDAAQPFGESLVVVGAQAVYLRTAGARSALAPFTTDGDLVIDLRRLPTEPALESTLAAAKFRRVGQPVTEERRWSSMRVRLT